MQKRILIGAVLAWLLPGLGHIFLGRYVKGIFFLVILSATYLAGLWLTNFRTVSAQDNIFYFLPNWGCFVTLLLGNILSFEKPYPHPNLISWFDPGVLYICVVGLLNMMIVLNIFTLGERR
jgi:hypothetical protein